MSSPARRCPAAQLAWRRCVRVWTVSGFQTPDRDRWRTRIFSCGFGVFPTHSLYFSRSRTQGRLAEPRWPGPVHHFKHRDPEDVMARYYIDCREHPSETNCTVALAADSSNTSSTAALISSYRRAGNCISRRGVGNSEIRSELSKGESFMRICNDMMIESSAPHPVRQPGCDYRHG